MGQGSRLEPWRTRVVPISEPERNQTGTKERIQNQMARIEFTAQIRNPQSGIVTNEARIDLIFPDITIGNTQDLERAVKNVIEKAVQALARNQANAT